MQTDDIKELAAALAKAQAEIGGAAKSTDNPFFKSKYADLASVWDACRGPLTKNGLSVVQQPRAYENQLLRLVTRVMHQSGQWVEDDGFPLLLAKQDMQSLGSAVTYARRYGLMAAVGIAPEDDDGNLATGKGGKDAEPVTSKSPSKSLHGPLGITALKDKMKAFVGDVHSAGDSDELTGVLNSYKDVLEQCTRDLPGWWYGDGADVKGAQQVIEERRVELAQAESIYEGKS